MKATYDELVMRGPGCWLWIGVKDALGYGLFQVEGKSCRAHRISFERERGPIPHWLVLDHLCRTTSCVNPAHLEPVSIAENVRRGQIARGRDKACHRGHPKTGDNVYVRKDGRGWNCRACCRERQRVLSTALHPKMPRRWRNGNDTKTACRQGHPFNASNTYVYLRNGKPTRDCRECVRARGRRYESHQRHLTSRS